MSLLDNEEKIMGDVLRAQKLREIRDDVLSRLKNGELCRSANPFERQQLIETCMCWPGMIVWDIKPGTIQNIFYVCCCINNAMEWIQVEIE